MPSSRPVSEPALHPAKIHFQQLARLLQSNLPEQQLYPELKQCSVGMPFYLEDVLQDEFSFGEVRQCVRRDTHANEVGISSVEVDRRAQKIFDELGQQVPPDIQALITRLHVEYCCELLNQWSANHRIEFDQVVYLFKVTMFMAKNNGLHEGLSEQEIMDYVQQCRSRVIMN